jgi:hypothetical protein
MHHRHEFLKTLEIMFRIDKLFSAFDPASGDFEVGLVA